MDEWLVERDDGLYYHQLTDKIYSGPFFELYDGKISVEGTLKNGQIHGIWKEYGYDENGEQRIFTESTFRNGVEIVIKMFFDDGNLCCLEKYNNDGEYDGLQQRWYRNGQLSFEVNYRDDMGVGPYKEYHENGQLKEYGVYKDGRETGDWDEYSPDGEIIYRTEYGNQTEYFKSSKKQGPYKNGRKDGIWEEYDSKGKLKSKGLYKNDYKEGIWEEYDSEGKLTSKGSYNKYGWKKEGIWEYYDKNGILIETKTH